ncbi:ACP S-malonyltransferase [Niveibacterium sp. 24ML]|uniref:ACP S-malonyltransferase n=1 Tax=Niveibacterium sp. 24ML TaxID=2985512 RepID=UPI002B4C0434|nr:ACP S-malonyltransferase [Niveibacterium sp. 24ML]
MTFAFVFPGQGSQSVGMMAAYGDSSIIRATFDEASSSLGEDLWAMCSEGPAERLALTVNTQPLMLTAGVAVWRAWLAAGGAKPALMAGHSLGEYSALVAAQALSLADAVKLVRLRAQAMQDAVPAGTGGMAAILGLSADLVAQACADAAQGEEVGAANLNDPNQIVIAGHAGAVARACELAKSLGAKRALPLPVSAPFHSALMRPAAERLRVALDGVDVCTPVIPVINNVDVAKLADPASIRDALVRQAYSPVRWIETVHSMAAQGVSRIVECGPGKVLMGLVKRCAAGPEALALSDSQSLDTVLALTKEELA